MIYDRKESIIEFWKKTHRNADPPTEQPPTNERMANSDAKGDTGERNKADNIQVIDMSFIDDDCCMIFTGTTLCLSDVFCFKKICQQWYRLYVLPLFLERAGSMEDLLQVAAFHDAMHHPTKCVRVC
jgi:hypothetical protein